VALIRQGDVVGVLPLADEKALVLLAPDGGAHAIGNAHCCTAFSLRLAAPGRSAAPRSRGALMLASARRLMCHLPRPSPPSRCCGSRCAGKGCPRASGGLPAPTASDCAGGDRRRT